MQILFRTDTMRTITKLYGNHEKVARKVRHDIQRHPYLGVLLRNYNKFESPFSPV